MIKICDLRFKSSDGIHEIHGRQWIPEGKIKGVVQIVHGVAEYIQRYQDFAAFLANQGYVTVGDDHLGHGYSVSGPSELGWFAEKDGWKRIVEDEKKLRDLMRGLYPDVPMILMGHSMGSFMARTYLGWYPGDFDACILSGTGWQSALICAAGRAMAKAEIEKYGSRAHSEKLQALAFGSYLKGIENPIGKNDWICRDEAVIRRYDSDPLCGFEASAGLMYDMMSGLSIICRDSHLEKMKKDLPILFLSGEADPVGGWGKGVKKAAARFRWVAMRDVSVKLYPEARHEMLNEWNRKEVWNDILQWLKSRI